MFHCIALCGYPLVKMELEIQTRFLPRLPFSCNSIISDKIWRKMSLSLSIFLVLPQISLVKYYETIKILMQIFWYFKEVISFEISERNFSLAVRDPYHYSGALLIITWHNLKYKGYICTQSTRMPELGQADWDNARIYKKSFMYVDVALNTRVGTTKWL